MILPMLLAAAASSFQPLPLLAIDSRHRLLEGVATDGRTVWVSSVIDGTILVCRKACRPLMRLPKPIHPIGITWDTSRQWLWIAADCPPLPIFKKCDNGALLAIDRNGRIRSRLVPGKSGFHPGDVSAANGNVFVGDALTGAVYWVKPHGIRSRR